MDPPPTISELYCPFPSTPHPGLDEAEDRVVEWMRRFEYIATDEDEKALRRSGIARLGVWSTPDADVAGAALVAKWMAWTFVMDDRIVETSPEIGRPELFADYMWRAMRAYELGRVPADAEPSLHALADLRTELDAVAPPESVVRVGVGLADYWLACAAEIIYRTRGIVPDFGTYDRLRESMVFMMPGSFTLSAVAQDCDLPGEAWCTNAVQALARSATRSIAYTHEYISGPRELRWGLSSGLISIIARERGCDVREAHEHVRGLVEAETRRFERLSAELRAQGDPAVDAYIGVLEKWIRGNLDWSLECGRYHVSAPETYTARRGPYGI